MKTVVRSALVMAVVGAVSTGLAEPEAGNPHQWRPRVTSVSVFKNGHGFFLREGRVALNDGWCVADAVPPAAFGTLAVYSLAANETVDIVGSGPGTLVEFDNRDADGDEKTKRAHLSPRLNMKLKLTYRHRGSEKDAAGTLVSVGPDYAVLEHDGRNIAVPIDGLLSLQVLDNPLRIHVAGEDQSPVDTALGMAYLRKGITWIPEYTLRLIDEDTAELTLRGTLINEAEDLVHCDVNFVVGVPHFLHSDYMAPLAVGQVIRTIGAATAPREVMTQIMNRAAIASDVRADQLGVVDRPVTSDGGNIREATGNLPQWEGTGSDDFTVFTRNDLTLRRGEKAIVTLFTRRITYSHLYRWSPPGDIQHYLVLNNQTDSAWTTGPCLTVSGENALSEDLLKYVPEGGNGELRVTTAIDLAHNQQEVEVDRQLKAHQPSHNFYVDLVTLDGTLTLRNYDRKPAEVIVTADLNGQAKSASDNGAIHLDTTDLKLLKRRSTVTWRVTLPPGKTRKLHYTYQRYVPSR